MKTSFKLHGLRVKINYYTPNESNHQFAGYCTKKPLQVFVNNTLPKDDNFPTIAHEMAHAMMFRIGLDQCLSHEMQEILAENFALLVNDNFTWKK